MTQLTTPTCSSRPWWRLDNLCLCLILLASASMPAIVDAFSINGVGDHGGGWTSLHTTPILSKTRPLSNIMLGAPSLQYVPSNSMRARSIPVSMSTSGVSENKNSNHNERRASLSTSQRTTTIASITLAMLLAFTSNAGIANAARKSATTLAAKTATSGGPIVSPLILPSIPTLALVCLLPTLLGYYRSEYGVSYGYGTSIAASSYLILSSIATSAGLPLFPGIKDAILPISSFQPAAILTSLTTTITNLRTLLPSSLAACHAYALFFYGKRLNIFLLYRELCLPRFRAMRERIEERSKKQGARWKRTPFLLSCAFLYFCMMSPLLITSRLCGDLSMLPACGGGVVTTLENCLRCSVITTFLGFLLGALGDLNKTLGKKWQGEDALITGGIFRFLRHPNYTGEVIGWTSSCLAGILAVSWKTVVKNGGGSCTTSGCLTLWKSMAPYLLLSVMGATGITFVLATATTGLEYRQKEKYGDTDEYQQWIKSSWVGFKMAPKKDKSSDSETKSNSDEQSES